MNDDLLLRANAVKKKVETGKESFIATKSEYEVNKRNLDETLAELKDKYNLSSYEELQEAVQKLAKKIDSDLTEIEKLLVTAGVVDDSAEGENP